MVDAVRVVHPRDVGELSTGWDEVAMLVVAIPLALSKRDIARRVSELVAGVCRRGRGERMSGQSRARYRVATHFNRHSLETALRVYDLKGRMPLWRIAQELKMGTLLTDEELNAPRGSPVRVSKQERLAIAASRKFRIAKRIIEGTGRGVFPALAAGSRTL
jgi:hypothetical protein